ncbi:oxidoreductase [Lysobacter sp. K5869]|uniref:oxidoreductase n=1 Tax=Lysobacter sp. K5869 TaxID=2820808 RepID=UPI001C063D04|nr:oxidoreductase [Lysobacter sp. K5869]QWP75699.1 oxidoreductase [Lysobacter sp. K5869]
MSESAPLRVALIGYGFAGKTFHAPLIAATPGLALSVVGSSDAAKVAADVPGAAVVADPLRAATDPRADLIVIATPNHSHAPLARAALAAGKHVVVDKPFTLDLSEARELAALAQRHDRLLSVFQNRRWDSDYLGVKRAIESGRLGEIAHFESHIDRFRPQVRERWREQAGPGTGVWWDLGPHLADQALQLFGLPERVFASLATQREGAVVADWAHVVLEYPRLRAILHAGMLAAGGVSRFLVHGSAGSVAKARADRQEAQLLAGMKPGAPGWGEDDDELRWFGADAQERWPTPVGDQRNYYAQVRDAVAGRGANPVSPLQAVALMAVLEAAEASAAQGRALAPALSEEERAAFAREREAAQARG